MSVPRWTITSDGAGVGDAGRHQHRGGAAPAITSAKCSQASASRKKHQHQRAGLVWASRQWCGVIVGTAYHRRVGASIIFRGRHGARGAVRVSCLRGAIWPGGVRGRQAPSKQTDKQQRTVSCAGSRAQVPQHCACVFSAFPAVGHRAACVARTARAAPLCAAATSITAAKKNNSGQRRRRSVAKIMTASAKNVDMARRGANIIEKACAMAWQARKWRVSAGSAARRKKKKKKKTGMPLPRRRRTCGGHQA